MRKKDNSRAKLIVKTIITAICMIAIVSVMFVGISAGSIQRLKVSSIVNIPAEAVMVDINCNVSGNIPSANVKQTYDAKIEEDDTEIPSWNIGDLEFERDGSKPITITIRIKNNNQRMLDLAFLIPPDHERVNMKYETGRNLIFEDLVLSEKQYSENNEFENIESTEDLRVLEKVSINSNEYYLIKITMSVIDIKKDFEKIARNFAVTMAVAGTQQ